MVRGRPIVWLLLWLCMDGAVAVGRDAYVVSSSTRTISPQCSDTLRTMYRAFKKLDGPVIQFVRQSKFLRDFITEHNRVYDEHANVTEVTRTMEDLLIHSNESTFAQFIHNSTGCSSPHIISSFLQHEQDSSSSSTDESSTTNTTSSSNGDTTLGNGYRSFEFIAGPTHRGTPATTAKWFSFIMTLMSVTAFGLMFIVFGFGFVVHRKLPGWLTLSRNLKGSVLLVIIGLGLTIRMSSMFLLMNGMTHNQKWDGCKKSLAIMITVFVPCILMMFYSDFVVMKRTETVAKQEDVALQAITGNDVDLLRTTIAGNMKKEFAPYVMLAMPITGDLKVLKPVGEIVNQGEVVAEVTGFTQTEGGRFKALAETAGSLMGGIFKADKRGDPHSFAMTPDGKVTVTWNGKDPIHMAWSVPDGKVEFGKPFCLAAKSPEKAEEVSGMSPLEISMLKTTMMACNKFATMEKASRGRVINPKQFVFFGVMLPLFIICIVAVIVVQSIIWGFNVSECTWDAQLAGCSENPDGTLVTADSLDGGDDESAASMDSEGADSGDMDDLS